MQREEYLAKSKPEQSLVEHTKEVLFHYEKLMQCYGECFKNDEKELLKLACEMHDWGKINESFQEKLKPTEANSKKIKRAEIPHGFLSSLFIDRKKLLETYSKNQVHGLITAVSYHHDRLDNLSDEEFDNNAEIALGKNIISYFGEDKKIYIKNRDALIFKNNNVSKKPFNYKDWLCYLVLKGLLNKLDYAASGNYTAEIPIDDNVPRLTTIILDYLKHKSGDNFMLLPAQRYMRENKDANLIVIAPTGSGKTEGALFWLDNAKGFYTLPLKVSSNAIFKRISTQYKFDQAALLHSDSLAYYLSKNDDAIDTDIFLKYQEIKRFSAPLTVCTVDQLFKFVFKSVGTEMFAATLRYSKLVIDEIQMYSPEIIAFLIYGLKIINDIGGRFLVMTATLPPFICNLMKKEKIVFQMKSFLQGRVNERHRISVRRRDFEYDEIVKSGADKKVLVLCNTVKKSQQVYKELINRGCNAKLLHAGFIWNHRAVLEEEIVTFAQNDNDEVGVWVSTQIVEASLDIDFDCLYTELSTMDSLFQRMGRCYRERLYTGIEPNVIVYANGNGRKIIYDETIYDYTLAELIKWDNCLISEQNKTDMISIVYEESRIKESCYYKKIVATLQDVKNLIPGDIDKEKTQDLFRKITSVAIIPKDIYDRNVTIIEKFIAIVEDEKALRKDKIRSMEELKKLTVNFTLYNKWPESVYKEPISKKIAIFRSFSVYDFDENGNRGFGLKINELDKNENFL